MNMKTTVVRYFTMAAVCAASFLAAGCRQELEPTGKEVLTVRIADGSVGTRASYSSYGGKFQWDEGDQIVVPYADRTETYSLSPDPDPSTATILSSNLGTNTREFYAVYPASAWVESSSLQVNLPASYDISDHVTAGNTEFAPVPMVAVNNPATSNLNFHHVGGLLRLTCKDVPETTKTVKVTFDKNVTGTFAVNVDDPEQPCIEATPASSKNIVTFTVASSSAGVGNGVSELVLNIPVPCGTYSLFTVEALDADNQSLFSRSHTEPELVFARAHGKRVMIAKVTVNFYANGTFPDSMTLDYTGGIDEVVADYTSYRNDGQSDIPVPFHLEYSPNGTDGSWTSEFPDWLSVGAGVDFGGSVEGQPISLSVAPQTNSAPLNDNGEVDDEHTSNLRNGAFPGESGSVFDLSTLNVATNEIIASTTANCYVVKAPGQYKFPLVYGNGVRFGNDNTIAFRGQSGVFLYDYGYLIVPESGEVGSPWTDRPENGTEDSTDGIYLGYYKNHLDENITTPYIAEQLTTSLHAQLLWVDAKGLIDPETVRYVEGETDNKKDDYITFTIAERDICQGNALIAIMDDQNRVAWSWHIWVTDADLTDFNTKKNGGVLAYLLSTTNVGWCDSKVVEEYPAREGYIRFVQDDPNGVTSHKIKIATNEGPTVQLYGSSPYYQGGRKDPILTWNGNKSMAGIKPCYPAKGENEYYPQTGVPVGIGTTLGNAIQHPNQFFTSTGNSWSYRVLGNGWNSRASDNQPGTNSEHKNDQYLTAFRNPKTIYDPSPVGFKIPYHQAIPYDSVYKLNDETMCVDSIDDGDIPKTISLPLVGYIKSSGVFEGIGGECNYYYAYTSRYGITGQQYYIGSRATVNDGSVAAHGAGMAQAFCIRPTVDPDINPRLYQ